MIKEDDFKIEISQEEVELEQLVNELYARVPSLEPEHTALFTTLGGNSPINYLNEVFYCRKIRSDCESLLNNGYNIFFVNYGTKYGMLAMQELLRIKANGYKFQIYCGKISGERKSLLHNILQETFLINDCDKYYCPLSPSEFIRYVILNVTMISCENRLYHSNRKIPKETYNYYRRFSDEMIHKFKEIDTSDI